MPCNQCDFILMPNMRNPANVSHLREQVTIQRNNGTSVNAANEVQENWIDVCTVYADVQPISQSEAWRGPQLSASAQVRVRIRWRSGITHKMRVVHGERILYIMTAVDVDARHRWIDLLCSEEAPST